MRVVRFVVGVLLLVVGAVAVAGAVVGFSEDRDADDFFVSDGHRFERPSFAITSEAVDVLTDAPGWVADLLMDPVDVRVRGSSNSGSDLFVGIAAASDVEAYLEGVAYDEVDRLKFEGSDIDYVHHDGTANPGAPGEETLWVTSAEGPGIQTLGWSVERGEWSVVVMNADASAGVDASLVLGVRLSNVVAVLWGVFAFGLIALLGGGALLFRGAGEPRTEPSNVARDDRKR